MKNHLIIEITNYLLRDYKEPLTNKRLVEAFDFVASCYKGCKITLKDIYQELIPHYNKECKKMKKQLKFLETM